MPHRFAAARLRSCALAAIAALSLPVLAAPPVADCTNGAYNASTSCTVPAGVTSVTIEAWGGGGAGAAGMYGAPQGTVSGGGGGGGAYCKATFAVASGAQLNVIVGQGARMQGVGYRVPADAGEASEVSGPGVSGMRASGGLGAGTGDPGGAGGTVAACTAVGAIKFPGGAGANGISSGGDGGGGGGSATTTAAGGSASGTLHGAGAGDGGDGGTGVTGIGRDGVAPGGGGGGGHSTSGGTGAGAGGGRGRVVISYVVPAPAPAPATVAGIPTLSEWGLALMAGLVGLATMMGRRRQRR